ncbi:MAG: AtpZ/AtpI family protein [Candidatus Omnitrophica bacterium]|nr:AtpZ/AtpI family protein [Candidatus Omnitrophota bacterium]
MTGKRDAFYAQVKQLGVLTTIPMILLVGPAIGFLAGGWIDRKARLYPWFTIIFIALGFIASGREVVWLLKRISNDS